MSWENPRRRRRRATPRRRTSRRLPRFRIRRKRTIPFESFIAGVSHLAIPQFGASPLQALSQGNLQGFLKSEVGGWTGINLDNPSDINVLQMINPFDFSRGAYWKLMLLAGIVGAVRKRLFRNSSMLFRKIPLIGRWVS